MVSLLLVQFRTKASEVLGIFGHFVGFSRGAFSDSFVMVESARRVVSGDEMKKVERIADPTFFHATLCAARCIHFEALWELENLVISDTRIRTHRTFNFCGMPGPRMRGEKMCRG